ncbi:hypothetical protein C2G38_2165946 [Gigaspora rosea]|uniref:Uncharacterized protein n=1 Tax=Gigaspora rosea TaxID=44941 RepID=A0A397VS98_9GLOM|nr:hypothetical protein C2G38_2165946 [Gigaspora rosea]
MQQPNLSHGSSSEGTPVEGSPNEGFLNKGSLNESSHNKGPFNVGPPLNAFCYKLSEYSGRVKKQLHQMLDARPLREGLPPTPQPEI